MDLEYAIGLAKFEDESHALKSHRRRMQHPGLQCDMEAHRVVWRIVGLQDGAIEEAEVEDVDHLDLYVLRGDFVAQFAMLPAPTVAPGGRQLPDAFPWGQEAAGKPLIQPGTPLAAFPVISAEMRFPAVPGRAETDGACTLRLDYEIAPYPNPNGSRMQLHIGIQAQWRTRSDRRYRNRYAEIHMTHQQYADVYDSLAAVTP